MASTSDWQTVSLSVLPQSLSCMMAFGPMRTPFYCRLTPLGKPITLRRWRMKLDMCVFTARTSAHLADPLPYSGSVVRYFSAALGRQAKTDD